MTTWFPVLAAIWLSGATALPGFIQDIKESLTKELAAIKDPIEKTAVYIGFSQCQKVKKIIGVDYDSYKDEPDLSKLELEFITKSVKFNLNLTALASLKNSQWFTPTNGLVIYFHGFTDDPSKSSYTNINEALHKIGSFNILALDASSLIRFLYLRSSTMVRFIGESIGKALATLVQAGLNPAAVHLIGHSLGSHIAGFTGKTLYNLTGQKVGRISGLDPAGPCFADVNATLKLNKADADFVDVIHSDAGVYGLNEIVGHVDFFPNRGSEQPNCLLQTCSHSRAWELYAESITNGTGFPALSCPGWQEFRKGECYNNTISFMGYNCKPGTTGLFALQTAGSSPFALGVSGVVYDSNEGIVRRIRDKLHIMKR